MLLRELRQLLGEAPDVVERRERALVSELRGRSAPPVVLFGVGNLGRRTLGLLRAHGHTVAAFADNDAGRWGSIVEGVPVLSPADAAERFGGEGVALVTIWRAEGGHDFVVTRAALQSQGWRRVESFIPLYWGYAGKALPYITIDRPGLVLAAAEEVLATAELWADERSLAEYVRQVRWRLSGDFAALVAPEPDQYFAADIVRLGPDEVIADCGAFDGDTLLETAERLGSWRVYYAFEPDPESFSVLEAAASRLPASLFERVRLRRAAVAECAGTAQFAATGTAAAAISIAGGCLVDCVALDEVATDPLPTYVKMDVEGAEASALAGARTVIGSGRPLLAIAAYHRQADLWTLPSQVRELAHDYRLFLRPHAAEGFDLVLYGVPPERLPVT